MVQMAAAKKKKAARQRKQQAKKARIDAKGASAPGAVDTSANSTAPQDTREQSSKGNAGAAAAQP